MNATEARKYLGVSSSTFYQWVNKGSIPYSMIDGVRRYSKLELTKTMKKNNFRKEPEMSKIVSEITIKVNNAKELQELNLKIKKAIQLNEELKGVLRDIQKTKLAITTEASQPSNSKSTEDESNASDKENCIADSIIYQLNKYDLNYINWGNIANKIEQQLSPYEPLA